MMIINNDRRPIDLICPKCKTSVMVTTGPDGPIATESRVKVPLKIKCPRCREPIVIWSEKRPLKIKCQNCGAEGHIKGTGGPGGVTTYGPGGMDLERTDEKAFKVQCRCGAKIKILDPVFPLELECPKCGREVKATNGPLEHGLVGWTGRSQIPIASTAGQEVDPLIIKCPKCKGPMKITTMERPLKVTCPHCGCSRTIRGPQKDKLGGKMGQDLKEVKCKGCGERIVIKTDVRPLVVTCPRCRMKGKISI
ncbi:MAG: hypothetical protein MUC62_05395 [Candidatus Thermoplasmatota archaeon]|nr:hypothetical protein [Candidatus Thermoplasmatota archaeon]